MQTDVSDRFWSKVDKSGECWVWTAARWQRAKTRALSYGMFVWNRKLWPAHRVAWTLTNGPIPDGLFVLHHCDNPPCVNPAHLYVGTNQQNMDDVRRRNRGVRGERQGQSKLTRDQVREIRKRLAAGEKAHRLGPEYGVNGATVWMIKNRVNWAWLDD